MVMRGINSLKLKKFNNNQPSNIVSRFTEDIFQMTGYRPGRYWQYTWRYIGPVIMVCILVSSVVCMVIQNPTYSAWNAAEVHMQYCILLVISSFKAIFFMVGQG